MPSGQKKLLSFTKKTLKPHLAMRWVNRAVRKLSQITHNLQFLTEWAVDNPQYFDHQIDLHSKWRTSQEPFPIERGVWSGLALSGEGSTLDLCCGDGFYSYYFYSSKSKDVIAMDFDEEAIKWAKRNYKSQNIKFLLGDIRFDLPTGPFDNIVWDAAVQHFSDSEIEDLMRNLKKILKKNGVLSGYSLLRQDDGIKHIKQHKYEFINKDDLMRFLNPYFKNVIVHEVPSKNRTNLYFYASDGKLPLEKENTIRS